MKVCIECTVVVTGLAADVYLVNRNKSANTRIRMYS